jgi:hypothetical protein
MEVIHVKTLLDVARAVLIQQLYIDCLYCIFQCEECLCFVLDARKVLSQQCQII